MAFYSEICLIVQGVLLVGKVFNRWLEEVCASVLHSLDLMIWVKRVPLRDIIVLSREIV